MADITMCEGLNCKKKTKCYRYLANPNPYLQSWSNFYDFIENDICDFFMNFEKFKNIISGK